ncbi:MAG: hypothetical protein ACLPXM_19965, partial [Terriglobales bacterium]
ALLGFAGLTFGLNWLLKKYFERVTLSERRLLPRVEGPLPNCKSLRWQGCFDFAHQKQARSAQHDSSCEEVDRVFQQPLRGV